MAEFAAFGERWERICPTIYEICVMGIVYLEKLEDLEKDHRSNTPVLISLNLQGTLLITMPPFLCESHVLSLEVNMTCLPRNP